MTMPTIEGPEDILKLHDAALALMQSLDSRSDDRADAARKVCRTLTAVCNYTLTLSDRIEGLRQHCDRNGGANISIWANEMWECEGMWASEDEDDETPAMYDSLDDLLEALSDKATKLSVQRSPNDGGDQA